MRLAWLVLLASTPAFADREPVRDDIVDIRHGRTPDRRVFLGWTGDGRAVSHLAACGVSDGGGPFCSSQLEVTGRDPHVLLEAECPGSCDPYSESFHWSVPTKLAAHAIRRERAALDALGPLQPSAQGTLPAVEVVASACTVDVVVNAHRTPVLSRDCEDARVRDAKLLDVRMSPDHLKLAVRIEVLDQTMEYVDPHDVLVIVDATS